MKLEAFPKERFYKVRQGCQVNVNTLLTSLIGALDTRARPYRKEKGVFEGWMGICSRATAVKYHLPRIPE